MNGTQDQLVKSLLSPHFYNHPVTAVEQVETHISRIFLAGDFAYKLKKPLNLGFLDFSTLEKRHYFCQEELRLNRRFSPGLYLAVCPVGGAPGEPKLGGEPAHDFLLKMKRFPCRAQLDRLLAVNRLHAWQMEAFAAEIASHHRGAAVADRESAFGSASAVIEPVLQNFAQLEPILPDARLKEQCRVLELWSRDACRRLHDRFRRRKAAGFIRECHGDIHLANMIWWDGQPMLFDCIEFNENLRWIDLINDVAFLAMDLDDRGERGLGWSFLNAYLQKTGDYQGVELLDFYKVYRAMVRAKVACMRFCQPGLDAAAQGEAYQLTRSYLDLADSYIQPQGPQLIIAHGLSGSGKTTLINQLAPLCAAVRIHSDVERKRLAGLEETVDSKSPPGGGIYSAEATLATYRQLSRLARTLLQAGVSVIVDATFLQRQRRREMRQLASRLKVPCRILDFSLEEAELRKRIRHRRQEPGQSSEATVDVLDLQFASRDLLDAEEQQRSLKVPADASAEQVAGMIRAQG